ncbi:MAG: 3-oxoadipate enol-lactonase [Rhizobacter sp.]|jgi:3-oxoadipate enol-lactonase|nr:3-oxoadipate enol-lactonase [Rhizobacter sp.]
MRSRINVPGAAIAYRFDGAADAPVLMLANSLAADMRMWDANVAGLARTHRVLRYDMRGHGGSSTPPGHYTPAMLADDAVALMDALRIERVHFVGLSLGGIVGQQLGARYPNRLLSLSLCDTMSQQAAPVAWGERIVAVKATGMQAVVDSTLERWLTPRFRQGHPEAVAGLREMILGTRSEGFVGCAAAVRDLAQTALLGQIRAPTLVLTGDADPVCTPLQAQALQAQIPGAVVAVIDEAAHLPNVEQPDPFNAAIEQFIASVGRQALHSSH